MPEFNVQRLLHTPTVTVNDVRWLGSSTRRRESRRAARTQLVFPYRGAYVRHLMQQEAVADASQVLFFNVGEPYQLSHPVAGGDASLVFVVDDAMLREITPWSLLREDRVLRFAVSQLRIDPRAQVLVALLRHRLQEENRRLLLRRHPRAYADHAAVFYLGPDDHAERAWQLASQNLANRKTQRAFSLAMKAALAAKRPDEVARLRARARD